MAKKGLIVTDTDVKQLTILGGNVDVNKFLKNIAFVQDIRLTDLVGVDLVEKLEADIVSGSISAPYTTLAYKYIKPWLTHMAASDFIAEGNWQVRNGATSTNQPDNANVVDQSTLEKAVTRTENKAEAYGKRLIDYLNANRSIFPEYRGQESPTYYVGWQLRSGSNCR